MDFGEALKALKAGEKVAREGWNGKGMWIAFSPGSACLPPERFWAKQNGMKTATGDMQPGWLASQADMLAEDWVVVA